VDDPEEEAEGVPLVAFELIVLKRSSWKVADCKCCWSVASADDELGGVPPKAHITFCNVSELLWMKQLVQIREQLQEPH
jgi:hypothetical protein